MSSGNNGGLPPTDIPDSYTHRITVEQLQGASNEGGGAPPRDPQLCVLSKTCPYKMYTNALYTFAATTAEFLSRREHAILQHLIEHHAISTIKGRPPMIQCTACAIFTPKGAGGMILVENIARHINLVHQPSPYTIGYCILLEKKCKCKMYGSKLYVAPVTAQEFYVKRGEYIATHLQTMHGIPREGEPQTFHCKMCLRDGKNFVVREDTFADHVNEYHQPPVFDILKPLK
ncbi:hypothetical protein JR316_0007524 [Psilocybe cubensis]|uniref:Uncharacterized protein n=2 Tax=Psilocybe cubensis TaxID=181762 RepID=A0A8H7XPE2_PSICU|nr:hypothetical protein JR316_0007524 [Psilocybe cubensis]KAH9480922.1 hypothetical protein JR316_0007524 [Psilocybe cubensis]